MTYLVECPYGEAGERVSQADRCAEYVPAELLARVPEGGFSLESLEETIGRSRYKGLVMWGEVLFQQTNIVFLDIDEQTYADG